MDASANTDRAATVGAHRPRRVDGRLGRCRQRQDDQPGGTGRRADGNARRAAEPTGGDHVHREGGTRGFASAARGARQTRCHSTKRSSAPSTGSANRCCGAIRSRPGCLPSSRRPTSSTSGAMADERAEQAVQTLYNLALKKPAIEEALMVIASFGAMQFLPELVRAIDNDWLRFADSTPERPMSIGGCPLHGHAHARQRHVRSAVPGGQQRHAHEARRGPRRCPLDTGVRRIDSGTFRRRCRNRRTSTRVQPRRGLRSQPRCTLPATSRRSVS